MGPSLHSTLKKYPTCHPPLSEAPNSKRLASGHVDQLVARLGPLPQLVCRPCERPHLLPVKGNFSQGKGSDGGTDPAAPAWTTLPVRPSENQKKPQKSDLITYAGPEPAASGL